jgi:hypothetical protein
MVNRSLKKKVLRNYMDGKEERKKNRKCESERRRNTGG